MRDSSQPKSTIGRFFEDFTLNETIDHPSPRTITEGDVALYHGLTGNRFVLQTSNQFARNVGYHAAPVDDIFVFNAVFGLSVPDISLNARANLGYAECDFLSQLYVGETIRARSTVIGLRETSGGDAGIVYVRTEGLDHRDIALMRFCRWVLVPKRDPSVATGANSVPELAPSVPSITVPRHKLNRHWVDRLAGSPYRWDDYQAGERIDHHHGVTIDDAEHKIATRLYRNPAHVHFDANKAEKGQPIVYGGHVISIARALSYNGLANACIVASINGGRHISPTYAGDTIYAWTEIAEKVELEHRRDIGALRLVTRAMKNRSCEDFPGEDADGCVLTLDYSVIVPRR